MVGYDLVNNSTPFAVDVTPFYSLVRENVIAFRITDQMVILVGKIPKESIHGESIELIPSHGFWRYNWKSGVGCYG